MVQAIRRASLPPMSNQRPGPTPLEPVSLNRVVLATIVAFSLASLVACDRNVEPYQPGEQPSEPDLARIFPGPPGGSGPAADVAGNSGQAGRGAVPPSRAEGSAAAGSSGGAPIAGRIELAVEPASDSADAVLFIIARRQGAQGGPPLAVLRIADPKFPLDFSIGPENVMIPSMRFEGAISLSARLDADGNAMTRGEGDISSAVEEPIAPGATGVTLRLAERG
jgi:hypothetical protein